MIIILKNIPVNTNKRDVQIFVTPEVKGSWFRRSGKIVSLSILVQKNIQTHIIQHHGLVGISPDFVAERVIKKLNGKMLINDKRVVVCEYKIRSWHNDPRIKKRKLRNPLKDRRHYDRREQYEVVTEEEVSLTGKRAFHTKGW